MVLVLRALGLGDFLTAVPALRALRDEFPGHWLVLAASGRLAPLAIGIGVVDEVVDTEPGGPIGVHGAEVAVNLHGQGPESHRRLLETEPGQAIWFEHPEVPESAGSPRWRPHEHEVERWCRLLRESGIPADPDRLEIPPPARRPPKAAVGATLVHPGAACGSRRWPAERWAEVVRAELAAGRQVVVTGGPGEEALAFGVADQAGLNRRRVLVGQDLLDMAATVAAASRVASADTGIAHLATALGRPSVTLFGPTPPDFWGPPAGARHRVLWSGTTGDPFASTPDPGLLRIASSQVVTALRGLTFAEDGSHRRLGQRARGHDRPARTPERG
jgi:ADP-heptose:LPS heptosyltransferase